MLKRITVITVLIFLISLGFIMRCDSEEGGGGGGGTIPPNVNVCDDENALAISSFDDLNNIRNDLAASYCLSSNIAMPDTSTWEPIGDITTPFTGTLDGANYNIDNVNIDKQAANYVGIFGVSTGTIKKLTLNLSSTGTTIQGLSYTAALVGYNDGGTISDVDVVGGSVSGTTHTGPLVGLNLGAVSDSSSTDTTISGNSILGGLIGYNETAGTITSCNSNSSISSSHLTPNYIGGLVGYTKGDIEDSNASGNVAITSGTSQYIGGLAGYNEGATILNSYATGEVSGTDNIGGLLGYNSSGTVNNSYTTGEVRGTNNIGGLVGYSNGGSIQNNSYSSSNCTGNHYVGGIVGYSGISTTLENVHSETGTITGVNWAGGLVGYNRGAITNSYSSATINGSGQYTGGLAGYNNSDISNSYSSATVSASINAGGIAGGNGGTIENCYSTGAVSGSSITGGFIGKNDSTSVTDNYFDKTASGQTVAVGSGSTANITGISTKDNIVELTTARGSKPIGYYDNIDGTTDADDTGNDIQIFTSWNFTTIWNWASDGEFPTLK